MAVADPMPTVKATTTSNAVALALFQDCHACHTKGPAPMTIAIGMPRTHKRASPTVSAESDSGRAFGGTAPARAIGPGSAFFRAPEAVRLPVPGRVVALRLKRPRRR